MKVGDLPVSITKRSQWIVVKLLVINFRDRADEIVIHLDLLQEQVDNMSRHLDDEVLHDSLNSVASRASWYLQAWQMIAMGQFKPYGDSCMIVDLRDFCRQYPESFRLAETMIRASDQLRYELSDEVQELKYNFPEFETFTIPPYEE